MIALAQATTITAIVAAVFILLALIAFARVVLRREPTVPRRLRVGVFFERDDGSSTATNPQEAAKPDKPHKPDTV